MIRTWPNRSNAILAWLWVLTTIGFALALVFSQQTPWWAAVLIALVSGIIAAIGWVLGHTPSLSVHNNRIIVRNPLSVIEIPASAVDRIEPGRFLLLHLSDGKTIRVWSVQAANISLMLERRSHVDRVAEELRSALTIIREEAAPPQVLERPASMRFLGLTVATAAITAGLLRLLVDA